MKRRDFLRTAGGVAGTAAAATAVGGNAAGMGDPLASSVVTATGDTTEVIVGPVGDDGAPNFTFTPGTDQPLAITPGTTVDFVWESDTHNIVVESQPDRADWSGVEDIKDTGFEYSHTFQTEGTYEYYCDPHQGAGMNASIIVSENPSAVTTNENTTVTGTPGGTDSMNEPSGGGGSVDVAVGPGGNFVFDPDSLTIPPGTTVNFAWKSNNHNVVPESQPDGAGWKGEGEQGTTFDEGHTYSYTFETPGTYEYVCTPHKGVGMVASLTVEEGASLSGEGSEKDGGGGEVDPEEMGVPFQAHWVGIATLLGIGLTLLLTFFFLKYGETPHSGYPEDR